MRDALSILDKIVSFTNGEVTYQNTLEHLNILDDDYYFKLMDYLSQQDLASAMRRSLLGVSDISRFAPRDSRSIFEQWLWLP